MSIEFEGRGLMGRLHEWGEAVQRIYRRLKTPKPMPFVDLNVSEGKKFEEVKWRGRGRGGGVEERVTYLPPVGKYWFYESYGLGPREENGVWVFDDDVRPAVSVNEIDKLVKITEERVNKSESVPVDRNNPDGQIARRVLRDLKLNRLGNKFGLSTDGEGGRESILGMSIPKSDLQGLCALYLDKEQWARDRLGKGEKIVAGSEFMIYKIDEAIDDWKYFFDPEIDAPGDIKEALTLQHGSVDRRIKSGLHLDFLAVMTTARARLRDEAAPHLDNDYDEAVYMSRLIGNKDLSNPESMWFIPDAVVRQRIIDLRNLGGVNFNPEKGEYPVMVEDMSEEMRAAYMDDSRLSAAEREDIETMAAHLRGLGVPDSGRVARSIKLRVMMLGGKVASNKLGRPVLNRVTGKIERVVYPTVHLYEYWLRTQRVEAREGEDPKQQGGFGVYDWYNWALRKAYESRRWQLAHRINPNSILAGIKDVIERDKEARADPPDLTLTMLTSDEVQGMLDYHYDSNPNLWSYANLYQARFCESRAVELAGLPNRYEILDTLREWLGLKRFIRADVSGGGGVKRKAGNRGGGNAGFCSEWCWRPDLC
jgi:hypothetical protein